MNNRVCIIKSNSYRLNLKIKEYYSKFFDVNINDNDIFNTKNNEYPEKEDIQNYDIFVFTGTKCLEVLCYDQPIYLNKMLILIKNILNVNKIIYGTCFGHQLISHFFGATIKKRCSKNLWEVGFIKLPLKNYTKQMIPFINNNIEYITQITVHHDYVYDISNTILIPLLDSQNSLLITLNNKNEIQTLTCQGHFLFDESYFLKHHNMESNNNIPYKYTKNLLENQVHNDVVKKEYLESKMNMKQFVNYYLINKNKLIINNINYNNIENVLYCN